MYMLSQKHEDKRMIKKNAHENQLRSNNVIAIVFN